MSHFICAGDCTRSSAKDMPLSGTAPLHPTCISRQSSNLLCPLCSLGGCWPTHTREVMPRGARCCKRAPARLRAEDRDSLLAAFPTSMTARISRTGWMAHTLVSILFHVSHPLFTCLSICVRLMHIVFCCLVCCVHALVMAFFAAFPALFVCV